MLPDSEVGAGALRHRVAPVPGVVLVLLFLIYFDPAQPFPLSTRMSHFHLHFFLSPCLWRPEARAHIDHRGPGERVSLFDTTQGRTCRQPPFRDLGH